MGNNVIQSGNSCGLGNCQSIHDEKKIVDKKPTALPQCVCTCTFGEKGWRWWGRMGGGGFL